MTERRAEDDVEFEPLCTSPRSSKWILGCLKGIQESSLSESCTPKYQLYCLYTDYNVNVSSSLKALMGKEMLDSVAYIWCNVGVSSWLKGDSVRFEYCLADA